jgi:hypothetical protein
MSGREKERGGKKGNLRERDRKNEVEREFK